MFYYLCRSYSVKQTLIHWNDQNAIYKFEYFTVKGPAAKENISLLLEDEN